ncbi:hypothetical protein PV05_03359 [Exophiala xenobiotica]|uniref:Uncharacterized protein n=1 Tax=Exophiala xenobiotica TaxID=348802 RepID=A0A0D2C243_9EURO|nr:uncharacterized protein PV05_03359 [Exophiala xenobiotica]KIW58866.1 hypothetical protein PV05_03359 [Exophiala xenobiotica]
MATDISNYQPRHGPALANIVDSVDRGFGGGESTLGAEPHQARSLGLPRLGSGKVAGAALNHLRAPDRITTTTASTASTASTQIRPFRVDGQPQRGSRLTSNAPVFVPGASGHITKAAWQRVGVGCDMPDTGRLRISDHNSFSYCGEIGTQRSYAVAMGTAPPRRSVNQPFDQNAQRAVVAPALFSTYPESSQPLFHGQDFPPVQPMYQQPMYQQPMYQQPMYQQPMYQQPMYQQPTAQSSYPQYPAEMAYPTAGLLARTPDRGQNLGKRVRKH